MAHMVNTTAAAATARLDLAKMRKIALASVIGTTVEWYDLFVFGTASALVFNKIFFPSFDPIVGTMLAFGTFASAYIARMVGAIIFGHFGDRLGRKSMLLISLLTMGAATFAIGLLPDYNSIGIMAPLLLLFLRVIQGLALGGEWGGAVLMTVEHAPASQRGFYGSLVQVGVPAGTLIANVAFLIVASSVSTEALLAWGWRIPFMASALLVAVGIYIRLHIEETPSFQAVKDAGAKAKLPFAALMAKYWKQVILGGVATLSTGSTFTLLVASGVSYGKKELGHSETLMLWVVLASCALCFVLIPFFGRLSDKYGRKPIIYAGVAAEAALCLPDVLAHGHQVRAAALRRLPGHDDGLRRELRPDRHVPRRALRFQGPLLGAVRGLHALRAPRQRRDAVHHHLAAGHDPPEFLHRVVHHGCRPRLALCLVCPDRNPARQHRRRRLRPG